MKESRRYIKKEDQELAHRLAQKHYDKKLLQSVIPQLKTIERFLKTYDDHVVASVFERMPADQKKLIKAEQVDDETYAQQWVSVWYPPGRFSSDAPEYYTLKGERVRSKTEKIIADTLYAAGIPYRYECPLRMKDGKVWRPDFLILNKKTRKEYILEHFGMMDDPEYLNHALGKISTYIQNDFFPGDNLILTFESRTRPFSTRDLEKIIDHFFGQSMTD